MNIEIEIVKDIPVKQIEKFEDRVVYNTAVFTREQVKGSHGYPYLTGELQRSEIASPIMGMNKQYSLLAGVSYGKAVFSYTNVHWTNPSTMPHWYYTAFRKNGQTIITNAIHRAEKEI